MHIMIEPAIEADAPALVTLRNEAARQLTLRHGKGPWSGCCTGKGVLYGMRRSSVFVARLGARPIATLALATRKPWAIDVRYFTPCARPLYLTDMVVTHELQRTGIGRRCMQEAIRIATAWPADAIRLDAYDAEAGAGGFYRACGMREVGRASYRAVPLIYFEAML